jgi:hypothetical protein
LPAQTDSQVVSQIPVNRIQKVGVIVKGKKSMRKVPEKHRGLLFPSRWCFSEIGFYCLPQAEKAQKA